jgi:hypothetical protein
MSILYLVALKISIWLIQSRYLKKQYFYSLSNRMKKTLAAAGLILILAGCNKEASQMCYQCLDATGTPSGNFCGDTEEEAFQKARQAEVNGVVNMQIEYFRQ